MELLRGGPSLGGPFLPQRLIHDPRLALLQNGGPPSPHLPMGPGFWPSNWPFMPPGPNLGPMEPFMRLNPIMSQNDAATLQRPHLNDE